MHLALESHEDLLDSFTPIINSEGYTIAQVCLSVTTLDFDQPKYTLEVSLMNISFIVKKIA